VPTEIFVPLQGSQKSSLVISEEEKYVTFQVALMGQDGIVLASDKCESYVERYTTKALVKKLWLSPSRRIAWTFTGSHPARVAAHKFKTRLDDVTDGSVRNSQELLSQVLECAREAFTEDSNLRGLKNQVVACIAGSNEIVCVEIDKTCVGDMKQKKFISGDTKNAAQFLVEQYFRWDRPLGELVLLAAHTVLMAHVHNPTNVEDLDIAFCKDGSGVFIELTDDQKLAMVEPLSAKLNEVFSNHLALLASQMSLPGL
jgi:20S proteasome alpha/beta subunit